MSEPLLVVYRVEDDLRDGPREVCCWWNQPTPFEDIRADYDSCHDECEFTQHHKCGCTSLRQLRVWFDKHNVSQCRKHGYRIRKYVVPRSKATVYRTQTVFDARFAEPVVRARDCR